MSMFELAETAVPPQKEVVFQRLMSGPRVPVYVLGRNKYAQGVAGAVSVKAFIDDFTTESAYMGKPVICMRELPAECIVVSCVIDTLPVTALNRLNSLGVREAIDYFALSRLAPGIFTPVDFCARNREDILANRNQYEWVYKRLSDQISKRHFSSVVRFRLNMDLEYMHGFSLAIERQYFEDFLPLRPRQVFVDGGGYDGQTSLQFAAWNEAYHRIHYFEPSPTMMNVSRRKLAGLRDVNFIQKGLLNCNGTLRFDVDAGTASALSSTGQIKVEVVRLDDEVQEPVDLVKLDIEGSEFDALDGAREHIKSSTPDLAVCIYHDQRDFWRVPRRVLGVNERYDMYVRHYSESVRETVMFFVAHQKQRVSNGFRS